MSLKLRKYQEGDEKNILALDATLMKRPKIDTLKKWQWEFTKNPRGDSQITVYEVNDKIVGVYNLIPIKFSYNDHNFNTGRSVYAMMHPKYGIYYNRFVNLVKEGSNFSDFDFIWTISNQGTMASQIKAGYTHIGNYETIFKILDVDKISNTYSEALLKKQTLVRLAKFLAKAVFPVIDIFFNFNRDTKNSKLKIIEITSFDHRFDTLWERVHDKFGITITRDSTFLNWRFIHNPNNSYKIFATTKNEALTGYIVLSSYYSNKIEIGVINDILYDPSDKKNYRTLIDYAIQYFRSRNASSIMFLIIKKGKRYSNFLKFLKMRGFLFNNKRLTAPILILKNNKSLSINEKVDDLKEWYLTFAFTEGIRF